MLLVMFQDFEAYIPWRRFVSLPQSYTSCNDNNIQQYYTNTQPTQVTTHNTSFIIHELGHMPTYTTISNTYILSHESYNILIHVYVHYMLKYISWSSIKTQGPPPPPSSSRAASPSPRPVNTYKAIYIYIGKQSESTKSKLV